MADDPVEERGEGARSIEHVVFLGPCLSRLDGKSERLDRCLGNICMLFDDLPLPLLGWVLDSSAVVSVG